MKRNTTLLASRALAITLAIACLQSSVAYAIPQGWAEFVNGHLMILPTADPLREGTKGWMGRMMTGPGQGHAAGRAPVAVVNAHGLPGTLTDVGTREVIHHIRNNFPGFAQAEARVLVVCYGGLEDASGKSVAAAIAAEFGDVYAAKGIVLFDEFSNRVLGNTHSGARRLGPTEGWVLVKQSGEVVPVSDAEIYRVMDGESASFSERTSAAAPKQLSALERWQAQVDDYRARLALDPSDANAQWLLNDTLKNPPTADGYAGTPDGPAGYGPAQQSANRAGRLQGFVRRAGSRAWRAIRVAPAVLSRIAVGVGAGLLVGMPLEMLVTELTGNRHLGFAAGFIGGAVGGIAAEVMIFGVAWGEAAGAAFTGVALWAAPAAVAAHLIGVALQDLEGPIASGDPQAIELALELTDNYGAGFFTYGAKSWWNDPGGTGSNVWNYISGN